MVKNWFVLLVSLGLVFGCLALVAWWVDGWDEDEDGDTVNDDY